MTEFQPFKPRLRNREVSFPEPESFYQAGELEDLLFQDQFLNYDSLPNSLSSIPIDKYATWLSQLTRVDHLGRERGAFLFIDLDNISKWIFPTNPSIGDESSVSPVYTKRPDRHFPVVRFHSHPDSTAPSGIDITRMLLNEGSFFEGENDGIMEVVGSQGVNYLMLTTADSQHLSSERVEATVNEYQQIVDRSAIQTGEFFRNLALDSGIPADQLPHLYQKLKEEEEKLFGADYARYFQTMNVVNALCEQQKFGFYHSQQNGVFKKVTREDIATIRELEGELIVDVIADAQLSV